MIRYAYAWAPLFIVGTVFILSLPWLGLIALILVSFIALPVLAGVIVFAPLMLARAIGRRLHLEDVTPVAQEAVTVPERASRELGLQR